MASTNIAINESTNENIAPSNSDQIPLIQNQARKKFDFSFINKNFFLIMFAIIMLLILLIANFILIYQRIYDENYENSSDKNYYEKGIV